MAIEFFTLGSPDSDANFGDIAAMYGTRVLNSTETYGRVKQELFNVHFLSVFLGLMGELINAIYHQNNSDRNFAPLFVVQKKLKTILWFAQLVALTIVVQRYGMNLWYFALAQSAIKHLLGIAIGFAIVFGCAHLWITSAAILLVYGLNGVLIVSHTVMNASEEAELLLSAAAHAEAIWYLDLCYAAVFLAFTLQIVEIRRFYVYSIPPVAPISLYDIFLNIPNHSAGKKIVFLMVYFAFYKSVLIAHYALEWIKVPGIEVAPMKIGK